MSDARKSWAIDQMPHAPENEQENANKIFWWFEFDDDSSLFWSLAIFLLF